MLRALEAEQEDCSIVLQLLDNTFFMAQTEEGSIIPARRELNGGYHLDGELILAPKELQYRTISALRPIFEAAASRKKILI